MTTTHTLGTREEWQAARTALLEQEKERTRVGDELARARRAPPWVRVEQEYTLQTAHGPKRLIELFTTSILGVTRLAAPGLMVLLEATAVDRAEQG